MSTDSALNVVLFWHMHQPEYRDLTNEQFTLPWTYLHAIKDYTDMAWHLEDNPGARAVVNFAPVLLDQLHTYSRQIQAWLERERPLTDPLLHCLVSDKQIAALGTIKVIEDCLRVNEDRLLKRFPQYERLAQLAKDHLANPDSACYLNKRFFSDLVVWYNLAWMGESIRKNNPVVKQLIKKGENFTQDDRRDLMEVIGELMSGIIPRYRELAKVGKVELAMSPYAHPMLPLLNDFDSTLDAMPDAELPKRKYPGGAPRAEWHIEQGIATFVKHFGFRPQGCWPSEGGVSDISANQLAEHGFKWLASGEQVLHNTLALESNTNVLDADKCHHTSYTLESSPKLKMYFRDDGLSDLIGFNYATWHADDAVGDLINHLHNIQSQCENPENSVVSIILDGENAWEYYPDNAWFLLDGLYKKLVEDPRINLTTYSDSKLGKVEPRQLSSLAAGSWVYGTFSTWIGDKDKNLGWDYLCEAKELYDQLPAEKANQPELLRQLAVCEGSDWFWWFGDYNPSESVNDFDELYRKNLRNLYLLMEQEIPDHLYQPVSHGNTTAQMEAGGVMRRGH